MVWRKRVSIYDDLSRIHRTMRTGSMSRELGYSSITMGEGTLDLLATDNSSDVRVRLGDQPDGRFGVGLWHRGGMQYLPDVLESAEDRITATEVQNRVQDALLASHQRQIDANDQKRIDGDESLQRQVNANDQKRIDGDAGLSGRLDGHAATLASHKGQIDANDQKRIDGDALLKSQIDANDQKRIDAVTAVRESMQRQIDANDQKRIDGDTSVRESMQRQINANDQKRIDADVAQSERINAARDLANEKASRRQLNDLIDGVNVRLNAMRSWTAQVAAKPDMPSPPSIPGLPNVGN